MNETGKDECRVIWHTEERYEWRDNGLGFLVYILSSFVLYLDKSDVKIQFS